MALFNLQSFISSPSEEQIDLCRKQDLLMIAEHYHIQIGRQALKKDIKSIILQRLVDLNVLFLSGASGEETGGDVELPGAVVDHSSFRDDVEKREYEAQEKTRTHQAELELRLEIRRLEIEADKQVKLRQLELEAEKVVAGSVVQHSRGQEMDTRTFYGRKEHDRAVRVIPSDSEDSELEESDNEDSDVEESQEDRITESGLRGSLEVRGECLSVDNDTESEDEDEDVEEVDVPRLPQWRTPHNAHFNAYPEWQDLLPRSDDIMSPLQYFKQFFSEDILEVIVEQSNLYGIQRDANNLLNLTIKELEQFLGIVVYMSLFGLPGTRMFWNKACRVSQVADTMTLNRWEAIKKHLHFNNNEERQEDNNDPLHKIRPLVTHLTSKLTSIPMSEKLAVDEQMVPFKGRNRLKQYLPSKPKKRGYKILVLAGSDGVPYNLEIYTGRVVQPPELADVGASGNVVLRLAQPIPKQKNYKLFFDNWFTSVPLVLTLAQQGFHCTGTVRGNRLPGVNLMCDAELKRAGRGSFEQKMAMVRETTLYAVKWYDNRSVTLLSDYTGAHPVTEVDRWDRKQKIITKVPCPAVVKKYNKNMGGVDLLDSLLALYRIKIRSKKWYHRLVFHFLDMIIVTTWLLYRRDCEGTDMRKDEHMKLYTFKSYIAEALCKSGKSLERKKGRPCSTIAGEYEEKRRKGPAASIPVPDVRLDATAHWMIMAEKKGRCKVPGCTGTPKAKCRKCDIHLCFISTSNCFLRFHTE
ncbi:piggyBac transposable element-derived protein 2-like [Xyrauchen texanus]|uniref:piggyBac transposable element-derived protein 2-like n=1 Tax=Xyrauchen texanus TaxID=154827 RepID=UPI00224279EF|nr:piggyBac transposable element-derived protein 2-like [Xyrauchen texanus]